MDTGRTPRKQKKFIQGAGYWTCTCVPVYEIAAYTSKHHRYHCEAGLRLRLRKKIVHSLAYVLSLYIDILQSRSHSRVCARQMPKGKE
ncbi:unnamed protein product [Dovyalis caffra]|uniref:Uncharacterized protein n=1 Tax=Dovyalis caffra TaxID=77055 RepID=A0AAV1RFR0_9ROSI|nr:unnamed protein product [Dovyalis caffra]